MCGVSNCGDDVCEIAEQIFKNERQKLFLTAFNILHNADDSEEVVSRTFLKLIVNYKRYCGQHYNNLVNITYRILKNEAVDILREQNRWSKEVDAMVANFPLEMGDVLDEIVEGETRATAKRIVKNALDKMRPEEVDLLYAQYCEGKKPNVIARELNKNNDEVRSKIFRARKKMAKILKGVSIHEDELW